MKSPLSYLPLASGFLVLVLSLTVGVLTVTQNRNSSGRNSPQNLVTTATEAVASLALSPAGGEYGFSVVAAYPLGIVLDSAGKSVDGADVVISFDPTKVQVVGTKIATTTLFEESPLNVVDNQKGEIRLGVLTFSPKPVTGIIGTFQIRPLVKGEATFNFAYTSGVTTDSNVAEHATAKDILGKVTNGRFVFQ